MITFLTIQFFSKKEESIREDIIENNENYTKLITDIKSFNFNDKYGKLINISDLPTNIKTDISNLKYGGEARYLIIFKDSSSTHCNLEIGLGGNWYIQYSDTPNDMPKPGSYEKTEFIEIWGVNKNWSITYDSDFI